MQNGEHSVAMILGVKKLFKSHLLSLASTCERAHSKHVFEWRQTSVLSNFEVSPPKLWSLRDSNVSFHSSNFEVSTPKSEPFYSKWVWYIATMIFVNKNGRNPKGVPLSSDLRNQVKELAQNHPFSEVGQRLRISKSVVSKIVKQYNLTGSTAPKTLNHVRTAPKCSFQDSILLETMVQASALSSLKELRDYFNINNFQKY